MGRGPGPARGSGLGARAGWRCAGGGPPAGGGPGRAHGRAAAPPVGPMPRSCAQGTAQAEARARRPGPIVLRAAAAAAAILKLFSGPRKKAWPRRASRGRARAAANGRRGAGRPRGGAARGTFKGRPRRGGGDSAGRVSPASPSGSPETHPHAPPSAFAIRLVRQPGLRRLPSSPLLREWPEWPAREERLPSCLYRPLDGSRCQRPHSRDPPRLSGLIPAHSSKDPKGQGRGSVCVCGGGAMGDIYKYPERVLQTQIYSRHTPVL